MEKTSERIEAESKFLELRESHIKDGLISIAEINNFNDLLKYLNRFFAWSNYQTAISDSLDIHTWRNNKSYLRLLASILILASEFGYEGLEAMFTEPMVFRVEDKSQTDYLDPRSLIYLAIYLANLTKQMHDKFRNIYLEDHYEGLKNMEITEFSRILGSYVRPEKDHVNIKDSTLRDPLSLNKGLLVGKFYEVTNATKKDVDGIEYDDEIGGPTAFVYDERFIDDLSTVENPFTGEKYTLEGIRHMTWETFQMEWLIQLEVCFPNTGIYEIFQEEFKHSSSLTDLDELE